LQADSARKSEPPLRATLISLDPNWPYGVTVKLAVLDAVPPGVVVTILPVTAPVGTVAVTCVSEFTVKVVAATPPKVTFEVWVRLTPVMATTAPTGPLGGEKLLSCGVTRKVLLLVRVPLVVVTVTEPVVAPLGTVAVR
jgi:hypothetical protein